MHQPSSHGTLVSIQVGLPTTHHDDHGEWTTGFYKQPVSGPVTVGLTHIDGDGQADLKHHGGVDKAVLVYAIDHFDDWLHECRSQLAVDHIPFGGFGENLSITGLDEKSVCVGDVWSVGKVLFEVSQPRQPCWKLARRWNFKELPKLVIQSARSGWYLRVKRTGQIQADDAIDLVSRPNPEWTVHASNRAFYGTSRDERRKLAQVPALSDAWRESLL